MADDISVTLHTKSLLQVPFEGISSQRKVISWTDDGKPQWRLISSPEGNMTDISVQFCPRILHIVPKS